MKPFLSYVGSKKTFMKKLQFPRKINNYYEPFVGGGSVFFELNNKYNINKNFINDFDEELINVYYQIKTNLDKLLELLEKLNKKKTREDFKKIVDEYNTNKKDLLLLAGMYIYLNKISFNGVLGYSKKKPGIINPSYSKHRSKFNIHKEMELRKLTKTIKETEIQSLDYKEFLNKYIPKEGDFVFFDPPYLIKSVTQYYKNIFDIDDFIELKNICDKLNKDKVNFFITLNNNEELKEIFNEYNIKYYTRKSFASNIDNAVGQEMAITNY